MPPPIPSIVGQWVTSFIGHFPVDASDFIPDFAATKFRNPTEDRAHWETRWEAFAADETNWEEIRIAKIKHPAPQSVLGSFSFHPDKSFDAHLELNAFEWFAAFDVSGVYTVQAEPFGGYGGEIVILNDDGTVHLRFRFLLASKDDEKMNIITSYIVEPPPETDPDPPPLDPEKMLQTVAGTMRRTAWH